MWSIYVLFQLFSSLLQVFVLAPYYQKNHAPFARSNSLLCRSYILELNKTTPQFREFDEADQETHFVG